MKRKIGILTFWNVPNYGTFFQAYALRNAIEQIFPQDDVSQIAYLEKVHYKEYYGILPVIKYRLTIINPHFYKALFGRLIHLSRIKQTEKKFTDYYEMIKNIKLQTKHDLEEEPFDAIVLGSDIIWDYSIPFFNHDVYLFGNKLNSKKIISFAASFGTIKPGIPYPEYVKDGLLKQTDVSVRDENSKVIVKQIANRTAEIVSDPTFLWNFPTDTNIPNEDKYGDYIIVYGSEFTSELITGACKYAAKNKLKLICLDSLDDSFSWCDINIKQKNLNPFKWLAFFKNAKIIFTCTYHGLMFGLIFNKKIVFNPTPFILDKASSLIAYLNLKEVLVNYTDFEEKVDWNWDYKDINTKMNILKNESVKFLEKALHE